MQNDPSRDNWHTAGDHPRLAALTEGYANLVNGVYTPQLRSQFRFVVSTAIANPITQASRAKSCD